jgi:hypothetical protein
MWPCPIRPAMASPPWWKASPIDPALLGFVPLQSVEDEEAVLRIHEPASGVAFILDLIVGAQMPLAGALHAPERIVRARTGRFDGFGVVRAAFHGDTTVLVLHVVAGHGGHMRRVDLRTDPGSACRSRRRHRDGHRRVRNSCVRRCRGRDDSRRAGVRVRVRAADHGGVHAVVGSLIRVIVVSIHTTPVSEGRGVRGNVGIRVRIRGIGGYAVAQTRVAAHETSIIAVGAPGDVRPVVER